MPSAMKALLSACCIVILITWVIMWTGSLSTLPANSKTSVRLRSPVLPEWSPIKVYGGYGAPLEIRKAARSWCLRCTSSASRRVPFALLYPCHTPTPGRHSKTVDSPLQRLLWFGVRLFSPSK